MNTLIKADSYEWFDYRLSSHTTAYECLRPIHSIVVCAVCTKNVSLFWNWCEFFYFITDNWTEMWAHCCYFRKREFHFEIKKPQPSNVCWDSECTVSYSKANNHKRTVLFYFEKHHCQRKERLNFCLFCFDRLQNGTVVYYFMQCHFE